MDNLNILKDDVSRNIIHLEISTSLFIMTLGMDMIGHAMFGSPGILGAGYSTSYLNGVFHAKQLLLTNPPFYFAWMITVAPATIGSAMFGSSSLLGCGYYIVRDMFGNPYVPYHRPLNVIRT